MPEQTLGQRLGLHPIPTTVVRNELSSDLRMDVYNYFFDVYIKRSPRYVSDYAPDVAELMRRYWQHHIRNAAHEMPEFGGTLIESMYARMVESDWLVSLSFIEWIPHNFRDSHAADQMINVGFINTCNTFFERHLAAYRFVDGLIIELNDEHAIEGIQAAIRESVGRFSPVRVHLTEAVKQLRDLQNPSYRNSIKESISAVESIACIIAERPNATLSEALKAVETKHPIHSALKLGFDRLYAYTSDENGIRHKTMDSEENLRHEDAIYMLVSCSAFVSYLIAKSST